MSWFQSRNLLWISSLLNDSKALFQRSLCSWWQSCSRCKPHCSGDSSNQRRAMFGGVWVPLGCWWWAWPDEVIHPWIIRIYNIWFQMPLALPISLYGVVVMYLVSFKHSMRIELSTTWCYIWDLCIYKVILPLLIAFTWSWTILLRKDISTCMTVFLISLERHILNLNTWYVSEYTLIQSSINIDIGALRAPSARISISLRLLIGESRIYPLCTIFLKSLVGFHLINNLNVIEKYNIIYLYYT